MIARPPSTGYLLRKLIRRHKVGFAAGTAVTISLIAGLVVSSVLLVRERAARERAVVAEATQIRLRQEADANARQARTAAAKSTQVAQFMTDMLNGISPNAALGRDIKVVMREILDATARRIDTELRDQPAVAADLRDTLGSVYLELGLPAAAESLLRAAVAERRTLSGNKSPEVAASLTLLGRALGDLHKTPEAEAILREALVIRRELYGNEHPLVADTLSELAQVYGGTRRIADARPLLQEVLAIRRKALGNEHADVATALYGLGRLAQLEADHGAAVPFHTEALAMRRRLLSPEHPDLARSLDYLGFSDAHELDRQDEAAAVYLEAFGIRHKVLGDDHPETLVSLLHLAAPKAAHDVPPETVALVREFVANQRRLLPRDSVYLGPSLLALASLENLPNREPGEAQTVTQEALQFLEHARSSGTNLEADVIESMMFFAWTKFVANAPAEGLGMSEESVKMADQLPESIPKVQCSHTLAWIYLALGRREEAARLFEDVVPRLVALLRQEAPMAAVDTAALGACYRAMGRVAESHQYLERALATNKAKFGPGGPQSHIAYVQCEFGLTLLSEGRFVEAEAMLRLALDNYDHKALRPLPSRLEPRSRALSGLGQALAGQGKFAEAEPLVVQAFQELQANEQRIAGNRAGMVREALDAVTALYLAWAKRDPSKEPVAVTWRESLEKFDAAQAPPAETFASKAN